MLNYKPETTKGRSMQRERELADKLRILERNSLEVWGQWLVKQSQRLCRMSCSTVSRVKLTESKHTFLCSSFLMLYSDFLMDPEDKSALNLIMFSLGIKADSEGLWAFLPAWKRGILWPLFLILSCLWFFPLFNGTSLPLQPCSRHICCSKCPLKSYNSVCCFSQC